MSNSVYNQGITQQSLYQPQMMQPQPMSTIPQSGANPSGDQPQLINPQPSAAQTTNVNSNQIQQTQPYATIPPGYQPAATYPMTCSPQNAPKAGVSAVNIQIFNPTAGAPDAAAGTMCYPNSSWYNPGMGMYPYPLPTPYPVVCPQSAPSTQQPAAAPVTTPSAEEKKMKDKDVVPLSDEYLKTIENYLNNSNPDIRMQGVKELLNRFKELDTRKEDPALTNLLNKSLQDPDPNVRMVAMTTLSSGYANGNQKTSKILNQIQQTPNVYGEDSKLASQALLKMASKPTTIQVEDKGEPKKEKKEEQV